MPKIKGVGTIKYANTKKKAKKGKAKVRTKK
jgi:hypothetical protein